jgi:Putative Flp pilus-assembly TadE/G-like
MKPPAFERRQASKTQRQRERGVTMVLVAVCMVAIVSIAALSIDVVTLYLAREEAQRSADTAALGAARVISLSGITGTADTGRDTNAWKSICGGNGSSANEAAVAIAQSNAIGGMAATTVTVNYSVSGAGTGNSDCSGLPQAFAINPTINVRVQRTGLPTFFSRIWSRTSNDVSASATAEVYNPSNSASVAPGGQMIPVKPRCVKPWIIPNLDPINTLKKFVDTTTGSIQSPGIISAGGGVIGEEFMLNNDCTGRRNCSPVRGNITNNPPHAGDYLPAYVSQASVMVPACSAGVDYEEAIGGCDQTTPYACGALASTQSPPTQVNLQTGGGINPGRDTSIAVTCAIGNPGDTLTTSTYPFQMKAGPANPIAATNQLITSSNSVMTVPIYDDTIGGLPGGLAPVTIVGFLQVFVNSVDPNGNMDVTVMNVAGCGNSASTSLSAPGTSPVPVRLITAQ